MNKDQRMMLIPKYLENFRCIGSDCPDTCCAGWEVFLDKGTYKDYKQNKNKELKELFRFHIEELKDNQSSASYGKIKMNENRICPFLDEKKLCMIHAKLGESYLSYTCTNYPKSANKVDGMLEKAATFSCPEIVRLAMLNPNGIEFIQVPEDNSKKLGIHYILNTQDEKNYNKAEKYFWEIRIFALELLQNRNYSLDDRLILLGLTYEKIQKLIEINNIHDIPNQLQSLTDMIETGKLKESISTIPNNINTQLAILGGMKSKRELEGIISMRYKECLEEMFLGLGDIDKLDAFTENYTNNYRVFLKPYIDDKEYILENFLVNEYFKEMMPFGKFDSIWDSYILLCVLYGMIKLHLIGIAGYHKGITDIQVIKLIQSFSKYSLHNSKYLQGIIDIIRKNNLDGLAYMAILVKN